MPRQPFGRGICIPTVTALYAVTPLGLTVDIRHFRQSMLGNSFR